MEINWAVMISRSNTPSCGPIAKHSNSWKYLKIIVKPVTSGPVQIKISSIEAKGDTYCHSSIPDIFIIAMGSGDFEAFDIFWATDKIGPELWTGRLARWVDANLLGQRTRLMKFLWMIHNWRDFQGFVLFATTDSSIPTKPKVCVTVNKYHIYLLRVATTWYNPLSFSPSIGSAWKPSRMQATSEWVVETWVRTDIRLWLSDRPDMSWNKIQWCTPHVLKKTSPKHDLVLVYWRSCETGPDCIPCIRPSKWKQHRSVT